MDSPTTQQGQNGAGSLKARVAARREQLARERTAVIPIPGFEDILAARYRMLDYMALRKIGQRSTGLPQGQAELANAADTLINACVEILEIVGENDDGSPIYRSIGERWSTKAAVEVFGAELADGASARDALIASIPGPAGVGDGTNVVLHFARYDSELSRGQSELSRLIAGESVPSVEG